MIVLMDGIEGSLFHVTTKIHANVSFGPGELTIKSLIMIIVFINIRTNLLIACTIDLNCLIFLCLLVVL